MTPEPTYPRTDDQLRDRARARVETLVLDWHVSHGDFIEIHTALHAGARLVVILAPGHPPIVSVTHAMSGSPADVWCETSTCHDFTVEEAKRVAAEAAVYAALLYVKTQFPR